MSEPKHIAVIGIGTGDTAYLLPAAVEAAEQCDIWVGGERATALLSRLLPSPREIISMDGGIDGLIERIKLLRHDAKVGVIVSGDPLTYSLFHRLRETFGAEALHVVPGISSVHVALSRLNMEWSEVRVCSAHGRNLDGFRAAVSSGMPLICLTDRSNSPPVLAMELAARGAGNRTVTVLDSLGTPAESIRSFAKATDLTQEKADQWKNSLLFVAGGDGVDYGAGSRISAIRRIRDSEFIRGAVPMTKEELRTIIAIKLDPPPDAVVYDIGAGTGAVSVELARRLKGGRVYSIDSNPEAQRLVQTNAERFGLDNIRVVRGSAPEAFSGLPSADAIFVGGCGPDVAGLFSACANKLASGGRLVATAVTLDKIASLREATVGTGLKLEEAILLQLSRSSGKPSILRGENPVHVFLFAKTSPTSRTAKNASEK